MVSSNDKIQIPIEPFPLATGVVPAHCYRLVEKIAAGQIPVDGDGHLFPGLHSGSAGCSETS